LHGYLRKASKATIPRRSFDILKFTKVKIFFFFLDADPYCLVKTMVGGEQFTEWNIDLIVELFGQSRKK
jgi:hypothetical protein